ncbi:uncharacterized protein SOCE26_083890 [Sorangium cellulosum]|uniref:Uncharacterized protein n=1 Tax=Sorangium cellulosum TaxID=56 RepID=A0A2L0F5N9_SORCE|nr:uncharacterized protein SOCE26_083890 [Sorangium cellulosum]
MPAWRPNEAGIHLRPRRLARTRSGSSRYTTRYGSLVQRPRCVPWEQLGCQSSPRVARQAQRSSQHVFQVARHAWSLPHGMAARRAVCPACAPAAVRTGANPRAGAGAGGASSEALTRGQRRAGVRGTSGDGAVRPALRDRIARCLSPEARARTYAMRVLSQDALDMLVNRVAAGRLARVAIALFHFSNAAVPARCLASPTVSPHTLDMILARSRGGSDAPVSGPRAAAGPSCGPPVQRARALHCGAHSASRGVTKMHE